MGVIVKEPVLSCFLEGADYNWKLFLKRMKQFCLMTATVTEGWWNQVSAVYCDKDWSLFTSVRRAMGILKGPEPDYL